MLLHLMLLNLKTAFIWKCKRLTGEMAQQVTVLLPTSMIPGTQMIKRTSSPLNCLLIATHMSWHVAACTSPPLPPHAGKQEQMNAIIKKYFYMSSVLPVCFFVCHTVCLVSKRPEESVKSPWTEIIGSCKLLCGCWKLNLGPLGL